MIEMSVFAALALAVAIGFGIGASRECDCRKRARRARAAHETALDAAVDGAVQQMRQRGLL
jgi:hypothetical protein